MAGDKSKSFLSLLKRTARTAQATVGGRNAGDETALWLLHERAVASARDSGEAAQRLASSLAKQRGSVDSVSDRVRALSGRAQELAPSVARAGDTFERLGLVALNAGLEGARLGETAGRALLLVSDEVRGYAVRGGDGAREVAGTLRELATELSQLHAQLGATRDASNDVAHEAARTAGASAEVEKVLGEMGERLKRATGSDPDTARAVAEAAEHARALVAVLATLSGRVPRGLVASALRPVLEPLARILSEEDVEGEEDTRPDEAP